MKRIILTWVAATIFLILIFSTGCKDQQKDEKIKLAFLPNNTADFWVLAQRGCEKADAELPGFEVIFRMADDPTSAGQRRIIEDLLARGIKGIAISSIDPVNQKPYIDELASVVEVITCDSDIPGSKRRLYIGTDNVDAGRQAGRMIKEVLPGGGKIMVFVGKRDTQNAVERVRGIREATAGANIEIVDIRTDDVDTVRAKSNAADALIKHPDLAAMVGLWNYNCPAILSAVTEAGRLGEVGIVCFDEDEQTLAGIKDGHIHGTVVQQPFEFGYLSIKYLADIVNGDLSKIPANGKLIVPTLIIKKDNVEPFIEKIRKMKRS